MKNTFSNQKTSQCKTKSTELGPSAGPDGVAVAPPQNRTGLPDVLKTGVESLSGLSMDDVRVHYNSPKPSDLHALAYAQGTDIHVGPGQEKHLPHEAWHVVQQKQGRVKPTMQMKERVSVNNDAGLEREADTMGAKAFHFMDHQPQVIQMQTYQQLGKNGSKVRQLKDFQQIVSTPAALPSSNDVIQMIFIGDEARHHMHVGAGVHQPHYKNGNSNASRINIGHNQTYRKGDMETVIDEIKDQADEPGAQACIDWCKARCREIIAAAGGRAALRNAG